MNIYDIVCFGILMIFMFWGSARGLVRSAFGIVSTFVSMYLTYTLFPVAVRFLRLCGVYSIIMQNLEQMMNLQGAMNDTVHQFQTEFINSLPQSPFILGHLQANNNPEAYAVLDVSTLSDYIAGYFANMAINLIAVIFLFLFIRILLSIALNVINILTKLPVINILNRLGGALFGLVSGLLFVWAALCITIFFFLNKSSSDLFNMVNTGVLTGFLYQNNPIMNIVVMLIPK